MALKKGSIAPQFILKSTGAKSVDSSKDLKGKAFILYFYPKDFTKGCTAEACEFRDQFEAFRNLDIPVFGISKDTITSHERFKKEHRLPFDLLSDPSGEVCKSYDALIPLIKMPKRVTYLINKEYKVEAVFSDMFESKGHIQSMLKSLQK
ncbi:peroxiredoxin [Algoriphagus antarcticus]|uniref:thioredoxin-dependent peroxiredoxin n=1 Tax=Algoriphagus antarcticus TaxID=238540 RepID=A0A3E0E5H2_9BACT|nr:peroxiredoxin [Algoriphagus antarcticus]REG92870.1 peroxiredoxin Q/BCP [Algoriphagus antarcticus]